MTRQEKIFDLTKRIKGTLFRERLVLFAGGMLGTITGIAGIMIILTALAGIFILPAWSKIALLTVSIAGVVYLFWRLAFSKLLDGTPETTAIKLERKYPDLKGRLIAALQFSRGEIAPGYSESLIAATLAQASDKSRGLNFNEIVSAYPVIRNLRSTGISAVIALAMLFIFPGLFSYSYQVYSSPTEEIAPPLGYKLNNFPGNSVAVKYRDVDLGAVLMGDKFPEDAEIHYRFAGGNWQRADINLKNRKGTPSSYGDSLIFYTTLKQVRRSLDYYVKAGRVTTETAHIDVVDRPRVTGIKLSLFYPEYTGLEPTVIDENDGNISAVVGSRVNMKIETNLPVKKAELVFADSSKSPFELDGKTAEQSFRIENDQRYYIHLLDNQDEVNPNPIEYYITAVPDEFPVIDVVRPGVDVNLNEEMVVPLLLRISDDYGFSSLLMKYSLVHRGKQGEEQVAVLHFSDKIKTEGEINFKWDVEPLGMMPSDYIIYYFELADNDRISGPKVTKSREYIARLPSLEEIIAQTDREQTENIDQAEKYLNQQKELSERLKNIVRKMEEEQNQRKDKLAWQHQKELEEIVDADEKISEQIKETAKNIDDMIDKMQENRMTSRELLEKLQQIQKLFEEVATPEMKEARMKLMEALKNMDQKELQEAMKDFEMSQKEMMERLDRTIALLKKMQIEQKITEIAELARRLAEQQDKVNKNTEQSNPEKLPSLAPEEKKVQSGLEAIKKESEKLRDLLDQVPFSKSDEAEQFCQTIEKSDVRQDMENMTQSLQEKAKESAMKSGDRALSKLMQMANDLQKGQRSMCSGGDSQMAQMMRNSINDLNYLSENQEGLMNEASNVLNNSEVLRDLAVKQQILQESMTAMSRRINEMGKESPFIAAELNNLLRQALNNSGMAVDQFSNRRGREGQNYQNEAMYNINRAAVRMMDALEQQSSCNKGGSCDKPSQMMQSLTQRQQQLNQQTQSQCNNPGNKPGGQGSDAMRRLAAEQNAIGKSLAELQQEFGNSREILGRLDGIRDDIDKIAEALSEGEVGQETTERQLKVYSRMLDASRTMQRKDFTDQRKANVGKDILRNSPAALSGNQLNGGLDVEDKLRRFLDEEYPAEYEQHIKAYFKALMENADSPLYEN